MKRLLLLFFIALLWSGSAYAGLKAVSGSASSTGNSVSVSGTTAQRSPLPSDATGYTVGQSIWIDGNNNVYELTSEIGGAANWTKVTNPGVYPASAVSGAAGSWGTSCYVSNWTQPILVLTRPSDNTTKAISCVNGGFDLVTANAFCAPSGGICYVTALHDQTDNGAYDNTVNTTYDAVQATLSNAPRIGLEYAVYNPSTSSYSVPMVFDSALRQYWQGVVGSYAITNTSGTNAFCLSAITGFPTTMANGNSGMWWIYPTLTTTGTGIPASTTVLTFNPVTGCGTFSANTTANATAVSFGKGANAVFLSLPSSLSIPMETSAAMLSMRSGNITGTANYAISLGVTASSALNSYPYLTFMPGPFNSTISNIGTGRFIQNATGSSTTYGVGTSPWPSNFDQVIGYTNGGTNGRNVVWQINNQQGTLTASSMTVVNMTGGLWGLNPSYVAYNSASSTNYDTFNYGMTVYGSTLTAAQMTTYTISENLMRGWKPQVVNSLICDGSSTTDGNGTTAPGMTCNAVAQRLAQLGHPVNDWIQGQGGGPALSVYAYPAAIGTLANVLNSQNPIEIWYPGMGNGFQQTGTLAITGNTSGNILITTTTNLYNTNPYFIVNSQLAYPGVYLSGTPNGCLATGTQITQFNSTTTFTISTPALGNCTSMTLLNETGANEWAELQSYDTLAGASGIKYILVGSAARGSFTTSNAPYGASTQLAEFGTLKSILMTQCSPNTSGYSSGCTGLPNCVGYVDLEAVPLWGGDPGNTTVASIIDSQDFTVNTTGTAAANYLVVGNRIEWVGMPVNTSPTIDTGNQTITAVSGSSSPYTITVSGTDSGLSVGQTVRAINPAPWTTYPCTNTGVGSYSTGAWNLDHQHYCFNLGYDTQSAIFAQALIKTGLLK